jgi:hypothetical protein
VVARVRRAEQAGWSSDHCRLRGLALALACVPVAQPQELRGAETEWLQKFESEGFVTAVRLASERRSRLALVVFQCSKSAAADPVLKETNAINQCVGHES